MKSDGLAYLPNHLGPLQQRKLLTSVRSLVREAPLFKPVMPRSGRPLSVEMTNFGPLGWVADRSGYRYQPSHPVTGRPWPAIPASLLELWFALTEYEHAPQACLVNYYAPSARMGLHRDQDETDLSVPVVSVSLGDTAVFRIGGPKRNDPTTSLKLNSGDVLVMGGASRNHFHGIDRILPGTSRLLGRPGRINLTLRFVG